MPQILPLTVLCLLPLAATFRNVKRPCHGGNAAQDCDPVFHSLRQQEAPKEPEAEPKDPEVPKISEDPEAPKDPKDPEVPKDPKDPETPKDPEHPEAPKDPEHPETPKDPEDPEAPKDPNASQDWACTRKNFTDKDRCGMTLDPAKTCFGMRCRWTSPNLLCPQCWIAKTCETEDKCPFRFRVYITGQIEVFAIKHLNGSIQYEKHRISGNPLVIAWFNQFWLIRDYVLDTAFTLGNKFFHTFLPQLRPKLMELIPQVMKSPAGIAYLNSLDFIVRWAIGDIDKFVKYIPDMTLRTKIDVESGDMISDIVIPEFEPHTTEAICDVVGGGGSYWMRAAGGSALGAMIAWRHPRVGLAVVLAGILFSRQELAEPTCQAVVPRVTKSGVVFAGNLPMPKEAQSLGAPEILNGNIKFIGEDAHIKSTQVDVPMIQNITHNVAVQFGNDVLGEGDGPLDLRVKDMHVELDSEGHVIFLTSGTYFEVDGALDAYCLKKWIGRTLCLIMREVR